MASRMPRADSGPQHHMIKIRGMLGDVIRHVRADIAKVEDPKAQALFETTGEV